MEKIVFFLTLCLSSASLFAKGECQDIKARIQEKKSVCKSLPNDQKSSCKDEVRKIKELHKACKANSRAKKDV